MARALDPFDHPIFGGGVDDQPPADGVDRLVVRGVDLQAAPPDDSFQPRAALDEDFMAADMFFFALFMGARVRQLRRDILIQRAAEDDIERLSAAADPQQR